MPVQNYDVSVILNGAGRLQVFAVGANSGQIYTCEALHPTKQVLGLSGVVDALEQHLVHRRHPAEIEKLRQAIRAIARNWVAAGRQIEADKTWHGPVDAAYPAHPAFPAGASGRAPPVRARAA